MLRALLRRGYGERGFTLIELLVSLTILALLLALVPGTLKLGRRAWETPSQTDRSSAGAAELAFIEAQVQSAMPLYERDAQSLQRIAFWGTPESIGFIVPLNSGPFGGGLYRIEAGALAGVAPGLRISLYTTESAGTRTALAAEERSLASAYISLRFRYFGAPKTGEAARWLESWPRADRIPDLVEIIASPRDAAQKTNSVHRVELKLRPVL